MMKRKRHKTASERYLQQNGGTNVLERVQSPQDLKGLTVDELNLLAEEIREKIIDTVSKNGS